MNAGVARSYCKGSTSRPIPHASKVGILKAAAAITLTALAAALAAVAPARAIVGDSSPGGAHGDETVMVLMRGPEGAGFCTGVVLSTRTILTAAHCLRDPADMLIHYREPNGEPVFVEATAAEPHPDYHANAQVQRIRSIDVGLIRTKTDLPKRFGSARLEDGQPPLLGAEVAVVGYGVRREGQAKTGGDLREIRLKVSEPASQVLLWLTPTSGTGGACSGDSGGPIYSDAGRVVALVAWTEGKIGRKCGALTQGVLLAPLKNWIDSTVLRWLR